MTHFSSLIDRQGEFLTYNLVFQYLVRSRQKCGPLKMQIVFSVVGGFIISLFVEISGTSTFKVNYKTRSNKYLNNDIHIFESPIQYNLQE